MSSYNKYLLYILSLLLVLLINFWFLNDLKSGYSSQQTSAPKVKQEVSYMTIRFNEEQLLDAPLIDKTYVRNGRDIKARSKTTTPWLVLAQLGKNEWDVIHVSKEGTFLLKHKKNIEGSETETQK